tara:strand:+ start:4885 stop:5532 length:648 start_codon:yes stop_codon:yes gene_type:complete
MARKPFDLEKGAIRPIKRGLWTAAAEKLSEAETAILSMEKAEHRAGYENAWTRFVDSLEGFWVRFYDEGKAQFSSFQPWAGKVEAVRKSEDLLQYLIQARHQSQHGRIPMDWEQGKLLIAPGFNGHIKSLQTYADGTYEIDAKPLHDGLPEAKVVHSPGKPLLPTIVNKRFNQTFAPPERFDGQVISNRSPTGIARTALDFYLDVLKRALEQFQT